MKELAQRQYLQKKVIGSGIREIRGELSQSDFARLVDYTQGYISELERGKCFPSVSLLFLLAEISGRSYSWILTGREVNEGQCKQLGEKKKAPNVICPIEQPDLHLLITIFEEVPPSERARFLDMALAYFGANQRAHGPQLPSS